MRRLSDWRNKVDGNSILDGTFGYVLVIIGYK